MSRLTALASEWLPPAVWRTLRGSGRIRYQGNFATWAEAAAAARGYDDPSILAQVARAMREVLAGRAAFERDGCLFRDPEYRWPVLAALTWSAARAGGRLSVLDFGGSLGGTFFHLRPLLSGIPTLEWSIVEQPHFVALGNREFSQFGLRFFESVSECVRERCVTTALLSSVLQYLADPWAVVREICAAGIEDIVIDRTLFAKNNRERICIQRVRIPKVGISYPCRLLSFARLSAAFAPTHVEMWRFDDELDHPPRDGWFTGCVFSVNRGGRS